LKLDIIIPIGPGHEDLINEAIQSIKIACLTDQGPFTEIKVKGIDDREGKMGRSKARNTGIEASTADWLFFLDADDLMHPEVFSNFMPYDHMDAVWGQIMEYRDGCYMPRFQLPEVEKMDTLLEVDPYYTLQMGFFVRREIMPKFDEEMNCGEDWKVYLELWRDHLCIKQPKPFMINRRGSHSTGPRSATGRDWMNAVRDLIEKERGNRQGG